MTIPEALAQNLSRVRKSGWATTTDYVAITPGVGEAPPVGMAYLKQFKRPLPVVLVGDQGVDWVAYDGPLSPRDTP